MKTLREMGETLERRGLLAFADTGPVERGSYTYIYL